MELKRMRTLVLASAVVLSPAALLAQLGEQEPTQTTQPMQQQQHPGGHPAPQTMSNDSNATPGLTGQEMKDKMFLRKSTEGGLSEVALGKLAADKGSSDDVKALGNKLAVDHAELANGMKPIADSMGIRLPKDMSKEDRHKYEQLSSLSGDEFDKAFILAIMQDHRKDWREFHEEMMATNDPAIRAQIEKSEPVMRDHMRMAVQMAKDRNIMPARPSAPPPVQ